MSDTGCSRPPSRRLRRRKTETTKKQPKIPAKSRCKRTILDYVHKDCMQVILDYLPMDDIVRSMKVSRQWQEMILDYLRGRKFCLEYYHLPRTYLVPRLLGLVDCVDARNRRTLPFNMCQGSTGRFHMMLRRLGRSVAAIILDRLDLNGLKAITQHCHNLSDLMLIGMQDSHIVREAHGPLGDLRPQKVLLQYEMLSFTEEVQQCLQQMQLKRISFIHSPKITEAYISEFMKSNLIEELIICRNKSVDGNCLSHIQSAKLKTLRLIGCALKPINLTSIADRLERLTMLELSNNPVEVLQNVHLVLDKTPNLECLALNTYAKTCVGNEFVSCLGRLGRLMKLSLCWNSNVRDAWLEAAARCSQLHTVDIEAGSQLRAGSVEVVSGAGVLSLCRGARSLRHLGLAARPGLADHVAAVVGCCPNLQSLDLRGCSGVSLAQLDAAAAAAAAAAAEGCGRAGPLRLRLARTAVNDTCLPAEGPEGLIFDFVDAPNSFRLV